VDHIDRTRREFARQADQFAASAAIADDQLTARLVGALGPGAKGRTLDVACGPGIVTAALAARAREVVAFDLTPEMLDKARQRCERAGLSNVAFREGSATDLPFPDDTFDAVVTRLSVHHFADPERVFAEVFRVLAPGGTFVVADVVSSEDGAESALQNAIEVLRDPSHVRMLPATELASVVQRAEFEIAAQDTWDKARAFEEWADIVADPERVAPLRTIVHALAEAGLDAGMGLAISGGEIVFAHRWHLIVARKPPS
jgi:ubiquinone/menaquinone biosynthesis C-methylase UbiE